MAGFSPYMRLPHLLAETLKKGQIISAGAARVSSDMKRVTTIVVRR